MQSDQSSLIVPFGGVVRIEAVSGTLPDLTLFYAVQSCRTGSAVEPRRCQIRHYFERLRVNFFYSYVSPNTMSLRLVTNKSSSFLVRIEKSKNRKDDKSKSRKVGKSKIQKIEISKTLSWYVSKSGPNQELTSTQRASRPRSGRFANFE